MKLDKIPIKNVEVFEFIFPLLKLYKDEKLCRCIYILYSHQVNRVYAEPYLPIMF